MTKEFRNKFRVKELAVKEFNNWILSIRPQQPTLGSMVISLKRTCEFMRDITEQESKELSDVFKFTENLLMEVFEYNKINYLCLMMVDEQVHFHVIPRYKSEQKVLDTSISDNGWPGPPDLSSTVSDEAVLQEIKKLINIYI